MNEKTKEVLSDILPDYSSISQFITEYPVLSMAEFDYYVTNKTSLFLSHENYDFDALSEMILKMEGAMPSVKRIFVKPIIQLKEEDEVLPVEAVRLVNNATIHHIASHSELWDDYSEDGIKPNKLLTRTYKDNYSIYENVLFARTIDCMLSYLRKNMRYLKSMMYTSDVLSFNLLERLDHINYYLALGKLHTGYIRDFGKNYNMARESYKKLELLYDTLSARLKRNVYKLNKKHTGDFKLHNSNILHMQRDYHRIYLLYKNFSKIKEIPSEYKDEDFLTFQKDYSDYLTLITLFAIISFGFEVDKDDARINLQNPDVDFHYQDFHLHVGKDGYSLILNFKKDKEKKIILSPFYDKRTEPFDVIYLSPVEGVKKTKCISISDVESFRRIEQILYEGMVYSDVNFVTCAFCGSAMKRISEAEEPSIFLCSSCNAEIREETCKKENKKYYSTTIHGFHPKTYDLVDESSYHYRNITDYTKDGDEICPICGCVHQDA